MALTFHDIYKQAVILPAGFTLKYINEYPERNNNMSLTETVEAASVYDADYGDQVKIEFNTIEGVIIDKPYNAVAGRCWKLDTGESIYQSDLARGSATVTRKRAPKVGDILTGHDLATKNFKRGTVLRYHELDGNLRVLSSARVWISDGSMHRNRAELDPCNKYKVVHLP